MLFWRNVFVVFVLAGFVASCGARGAPELPPGIKKGENKDEGSILDPLID